MPLIQCTNCGSQVSDRAATCPKCHADLSAPAPQPPEPPQVKCEECGQSFDASLSTCPNCGAPVGNSSVPESSIAAAPAPSSASTSQVALSAPNPSPSISPVQPAVPLSERVNPISAYINMWKNFDDFTSRTSRKSFWMAFIIQYAITWGLVIINFIVMFIRKPSFISLPDYMENYQTPFIFALAGAIFALQDLPFAAMLARRYIDSAFPASSLASIQSRAKILGFTYFALSFISTGLDDYLWFTFLSGLITLILVIVIGVKKPVSNPETAALKSV